MNQKNHSGQSETECKYDLQNFLDYIDGVLDGETIRIFESHLQDCPFCANMLEGLRSVTPETTRQMFSDVDIERAQSANNRFLSDGLHDLPFAANRSKQPPPDADNESGGCNANHPLKQLLDKMVVQTLRNVQQLILITIPELAGTSLYSAVRSGNASPVRMDIINMTSVPLLEDRLSPSTENGKWLLDGCPAGFLNHEAYLVLLPISALKELIPGWNPAESQNQLAAFFSDGNMGITMPGVSVTSGRFVDRKDTATLVLDIPPEIDRLLRATDRMTAAILIV